MSAMTCEREREKNVKKKNDRSHHVMIAIPAATIKILQLCLCVQIEPWRPLAPDVFDVQEGNDPSDESLPGVGLGTVRSDSIEEDHRRTITVWDVFQ